jgi:hypothetical protein
VPVALLDVIIGVLGTLGRVVPALAAKAELARIGRYYATELLWDPAAGRHAGATSVPSETLLDHYAQLVGEAMPSTTRCLSTVAPCWHLVTVQRHRHRRCVPVVSVMHP